MKDLHSTIILLPLLLPCARLYSLCQVIPSHAVNTFSNLSCYSSELQLCPCLPLLTCVRFLPPSLYQAIVCLYSYIRVMIVLPFLSFPCVRFLPPSLHQAIVCLYSYINRHSYLSHHTDIIALCCARFLPPSQLFEFLHTKRVYFLLSFLTQRIHYNCSDHENRMFLLSPPKRSYGKVMFSQVSVCPQEGGGSR